MTMAGTLDNRYASIRVPTQNKHRQLNTSADGVVTTGTFTGRRVLDVQESSTGSMFEPYDSPDNTGYYDTIRIKKPNRVETLRWIEVIAHETGHAFNLVSRTSPPAAKMADRIRDAIADEIATSKDRSRRCIGDHANHARRPATEGSNAKYWSHRSRHGGARFLSDGLAPHLSRALRPQ